MSECRSRWSVAVGTPIPSAVDPGKAEQTRHRASRSFVQWRAPPGRPAPRLLHGVWVDGRRDGSWRKVRVLQHVSHLRQVRSSRR